MPIANMIYSFNLGTNRVIGMIVDIGTIFMAFMSWRAACQCRTLEDFFEVGHFGLLVFAFLGSMQAMCRLLMNAKMILYPNGDHH